MNTGIRVLAALIACSLIAGCSGQPETSEAETAESQVKDLAEKFAVSVSTQDWDAVCEILSSDMQKAATMSPTGDCTDSNALDLVLGPKDEITPSPWSGLVVEDVVVSDDGAIVTYKQKRSKPQISLVVIRENGEWRIDEM